MNIDPKEKEKFNKIADEWWDPSGKFAPLHKINPLRANYISERTDLKNKKILDVACGGGLLAEALFSEGAKVSGVDISDVAIHTAKNHAKKKNIDINYILGEAENLLPENLRKTSGSFYTPRKVVSYMCEQSLSNFLLGHFKSEFNKKELDNFLINKDTIINFLELSKILYDNSLTVYDKIKLWKDK